MSERLHGTVLFYWNNKGKIPFGFIGVDYAGTDESLRPPDIFFCVKGLGNSCGRIGRKSIEAGQRVSYIVSEFNGKPVATEIEKDIEPATIKTEINENRW